MPRKSRSKSQQPEPPIYTFRVRILESIYAPTDCRNIWRGIEIAANQPLAHLGQIIPYAFDFDDPHLWAFFLSGKPWDQTTEYSADPEPMLPRESILAMRRELRAQFGADAFPDLPIPEPPSPQDAYQVAIRDVPLPGKTGKKEFLYIFDFGDEWHFGVKLLRTSPTVEPGAQYPRVVAEVGQAPPQYLDAEEFDWDEVEIIVPEVDQEPGQHPE